MNQQLIIGTGILSTADNHLLSDSYATLLDYRTVVANYVAIKINHGDTHHIIPADLR